MLQSFWGKMEKWLENVRLLQCRGKKWNHKLEHFNNAEEKLNEKND